MNALTYKPPKEGDYTLAGANCDYGAYKLVSEIDYAIAFERLYLTYMRDELLLDKIADRVFEGKSRAMIAVSRTLEEVGEFDKRHGMSEVMYLHKIGLLDKVDALVGGVWLDKDDADLMAQCSCPLILTPSFDMGRGHGIPETVMCLKRGLKVGLGTEDCLFNPSADVKREAELLRLTAAALMHDENALSDLDLKKMINFTL